MFVLNVKTVNVLYFNERRDPGLFICHAWINIETGGLTFTIL